MPSRHHQSATIATIGCCLTAACLFVAPDGLVQSMQSIVRDGLMPGQKAVAWITTPKAPPTDQTNPTDSTQDADVQELLTALRQRDLRISELQQQLANGQRYGNFPFEATSNNSLVIPELLTANVLSHQKDHHGIAEIVIDKGNASDITVDQLVLDASAPIIDQGTDQSLEKGQPVYAGRSVIGRINQAGRWTSSLQLTTDKDYSGIARLARQTSQGLQFGAEGILEGQGNGLCHLTGIPATQPVAVGDEVFTGGQSSVLRQPMYYGKIIAANLQPGSTWHVVVQPDFDLKSLKSVVVLRATLNPIRILGQ